MRLIDADALIETIENVCCKPCKEQKHDYNGVRCRACQYGDEIDDIDSFHTAEQPHWIPCSERLPKKKKQHYWVCTDTGYQCQCRWTDDVYGLGVSDRWAWKIFDIPQYQKVVAWMPLPIPYKEGEQE